jgi:hypothetical protein
VLLNPEYSISPARWVYRLTQPEASKGLTMKIRQLKHTALNKVERNTFVEHQYSLDGVPSGYCQKHRLTPGSLSFNYTKKKTPKAQKDRDLVIYHHGSTGLFGIDFK